MDCAKVGELTSEYLEGTLPAALGRAVRAHLDGCPACAADVAAVRSVWSRLADLPAVDPPSFFHENVMAAVARSQKATRRAPWQMLPQLGRVALSTMAVAGMAAAVLWKLLGPSFGLSVSEAGETPLPHIIARGRISAAPDPAPRLRIVRTSLVHPEYGPAYEFGVRIEQAEHGAARLHLLPDDALDAKTLPPALLTVSGARAAARLCVPFKSVRGQTMNLYVRWVADGETHTTYQFVPVPRSDALPPERQSFGLPESSLPVAARAAAERYGRPITLEDVPGVDGVSVIAREETAAEALQKALAGRGLRLTETETGIRIAPP